MLVNFCWFVCGVILHRLLYSVIFAKEEKIVYTTINIHTLSILENISNSINYTSILQDEIQSTEEEGKCVTPELQDTLRETQMDFLIKMVNNSYPLKHRDCILYEDWQSAKYLINKMKGKGEPL